MEEKKEQNAVVTSGIDYAIKLSYSAVNASDRADKRDLLYSLACFGCSFDDCFATDPDPILLKYDCLKYPEPKKFDLYELARVMVTLSNATLELKQNWFILFGYVLLCDAPHDVDTYEFLCATLHTEEIFAEVLRSKYSVYVLPTVEELEAQGFPSLLVRWYAPYLSYCSERVEHGITRETAECRRLMQFGDYETALIRCERLLAAFSDDIQIVLTDIAARTSLSSTCDRESRETILRETLEIIDQYLDLTEGNPKLYLRYYRGLSLLGLMDPVGARAEFSSCLEDDPSFELSKLMLKGMDKYGQ